MNNNNLKKKILLVSFKIPYPLNSGGAIAQYYFLNQMINQYDVTLCTLSHNPYQKKCVDELKKSFPRLKVDYLDLSSDSKKDRNSITKLLLRLNNRIKNILIGELRSEYNYNDFNLNRINESFIIFFKNLLKNNKYDIIQLEFFESLTLIPILPNSVKKIIVHHEIRAKRNEFTNPKNIYSEYLNKVIQLNELSLLNLADVVVVFNKADEDYLKNIKAATIISPFGIPNELIHKREVSNKFDKLLFIGSENHYPNKEGLNWFLDEIYLPNQNKINLPFLITGDWKNEFKSRYKENKNIQFAGFEPSLNKIFERSIMVTPIISGSGIRTKILQAFANCVPVISTCFASEGLYDKPFENEYIIHFEDSKDFVKIIDTAHRDPNYLCEVAINGNLFYKDNFEKDKLFKTRFEIYSNE